MKRFLTIGTLMLATLLTTPVMPAAAGEQDAEDAQAPKHKKVVVKKKSGKTVVVRRGAHGHPVHVARPVVVHHKQVVVKTRPAVVHTAVVVPRRTHETVTHYPPRQEDEMLGIGLRVGGVAVDGEKLNLATVENPTMWGPGLQIRGKVSHRVGLELGLDYLVGTTDEVTQTTVPLTLSAMYYFFPTSQLRLFGLVGGGVHFTKLEYERGFRHDLVEVAGQAGGGIDLRLTREFGLNADLRFVGLYKNMGEATEIEHKCLTTSAGGTCGGIYQTEKFNIGAQFLVGASVYF
jgi:hypothetical protein